MKVISIAGAVGRDAELRQVSGSDVCQFSVAVDDGFGENKKTVWFDVSRWGKGASGLANVLVKGSRVAVSGELSTLEKDVRTYLKVRADKVTILSTPQGGRDNQRGNQERQQRGGGSDWGQSKSNGGWGDDDLDADQVPFLHSDSIF